MLFRIGGRLFPNVKLIIPLSNIRLLPSRGLFFVKSQKYLLRLQEAWMRAGLSRNEKLFIYNVSYSTHNNLLICHHWTDISSAQMEIYGKEGSWHRV